MTYIRERINPILEALVTAVLLERPEDPMNFMIKWLAEQNAEKTATSSDEVEMLQREIERLEARRKFLVETLGGSATDFQGPKIAATTHTHVSTESVEDEEDDDDEDDMVDDIPPPSFYKKGPRSSVSAEAYGEWNKKKTDFVAPVHDKPPDIVERIVKRLASSFLFSNLENKDKDIVVGAMKVVEVEPQGKIITQGDEGDCLYVIDSGVLECFKKIGEEEKLVATLGAGDAFGELALLYNCPRAASVVCKEKAILAELDRETFNYIVKDAASKKREMHEGFLKSVKILANLDSYEIMRIADALKVVIYAKGDYIIKQGEAGNEFFMIEEGKVVVTKTAEDGGEESVVNAYGEKDYFGELALLKNEPRAANVIADSEVRVVSLDRKTFTRLLGPLKDIVQRTY